MNTHVLNSKFSYFWCLSHVKAYQKLCGSTILENTPCAHGTDGFAIKLRYSLGKLFYKLKNITILNRNNNGKRQIQIMKMMWGFCHNKKLTKLKKNDVSWFRQSRTTSVVCLHLYVRHSSPSINFCYGDSFADALAKGTFLTLTTQTLPISKGENCSVDDSLYTLTSL